MNVNMIKLPLIRVAHPSQEDCEKEYQKITGKIDGKSASPQKYDHDDEFNVRIDAHGTGPPNTRKPEYNPHLFNFEHPYDPELTPRKKWKATVTNLDSIIEQEREKYRTLEIQQIELKQDFEAEIVKINSKLQEEVLKTQLLNQ